MNDEINVTPNENSPNLSRNGFFLEFGFSFICLRFSSLWLRFLMTNIAVFVGFSSIISDLKSIAIEVNANSLLILTVETMDRPVLAMPDIGSHLLLISCNSRPVLRCYCDVIALAFAQQNTLSPLIYQN